MTQYGPNMRRRINLRGGATMAVSGCPRRTPAREKNSGSTLANAMRAWATRIKTFFGELKSPSTRIADAALASAR